MNKHRVALARIIAEEFIRRAKDFEAVMEDCKSIYQQNPTKEASALKRQSMELTRQLAEMRKAK